MLTISRTLVDFVRSWILLRINMKINISLLNDFFEKMLKLPMSFFDTKLMGDLMQRISDHNRVNNFLTQKTLNIAFSLITFVIFGAVLFYYQQSIFLVLYWEVSCMDSGYRDSCSEGSCWIMNFLSSNPSITIKPMSLLRLCRKSNCKTVNSASARNGKWFRLACLGYKLNL